MRHVTPRFSSDKESLSITYLSILRDVLAENNLEMHGSKLSARQFNDFHTRVTLDDFLHIIDKTITDTGCTSLGLQYGERLTLAAGGPLGQLLMASPSVRSALQHWLKYYILYSLSMQFDTHYANGKLSVKVQRLYRSTSPEHIKWFSVESLLYCLLYNSRWLCDEKICFEELHLDYAAPPHWEMYKSYFGCEIFFNTGENRVVLSDDFLNKPITLASEPIRQLKEAQCSELMRRWMRRFDVTEQIIAMLHQQCPNIPSLEEMSAILNLSSSSLYRRLRKAGTTYQQIVDDFRRDQAAYYLANSQLTVSDIAAELGFSDTSNFRRAFKKWTGATPATYRDSCQLRSHSQH